MTALNSAVIWWLTTSQASDQAQFWIWSGPGAFMGCVDLSESEIESLEKKVFGGGRYSALGCSDLGKGAVETSSRLHCAVATHVALKRDVAFSGFVTQCEPSLLVSVEINCVGFFPEACLFA